MTDLTLSSLAAADRLLSALRADPVADAADRLVRERGERTLARQVEISEVPAPPFGERARGRRFAELMEDVGLVDVRSDDVGNVLGWLGSPATPAAGPFVVSAHLDTVFPEGTDVRVTRQGALLRGPGISDDARGLAALLAIAEALAESGFTPARPLLFVGTVGEEGAGDLRGETPLRRGGRLSGRHRLHLARRSRARPHRDQGPGVDALPRDRARQRGSLLGRLRDAQSDPRARSHRGRHRFDPSARPEALVGDDRPLGRRHEHQRDPRIRVARDRRAGEESEELARIEREVRSVVAAAAEDHPDLGFDVLTIGRRPCGATDAGDPLVQAAAAATRAFGGSRSS